MSETTGDAFAVYVRSLGVDANEEHDGDEWWAGYRQAQRDNIRRAETALSDAHQHDAKTGEPRYDLDKKTWDKTCPCITAMQTDPDCEWHGRLARHGGEEG